MLVALLDLPREPKRAKLLQFGERVWNIGSSSDDQRIDATIARRRRILETAL